MPTVLIAGIGGGSLGMEIAKSLQLAGNYRIVGCDISPMAFGHYAGLCDATHLIPRDTYLEQLYHIVRTERVDVLVPGAEEPMALLASGADRFAAAGARLAMNPPDLVRRLSDKAACFAELQALGVKVPRTVVIDDPGRVADVPLPCVVKPSTGTGGSSLVSFARTPAQVAFFAAQILADGRSVIAQEYLGLEGGEFSVGVLSEPNGGVAGTIALKRAFPTKLSIATQGDGFLISSGVSQGHIGLYPDVCATSRAISEKLGSRGPLNIQGRLDHEGRLVPFEINPRFSASTHLRALAGFNEIDYYIGCLLGEPRQALTIKPGWYLRGLTELVVGEAELRS
jgi:carbamoyl-phosphate synthase large subunit